MSFFFLKNDESVEGGMPHRTATYFFRCRIIEDRFYNFFFLFQERFVLFHFEAEYVHNKDAIEVKNMSSYHQTDLSLCKQQEFTGSHVHTHQFTIFGNESESDV